MSAFFFSNMSPTSSETRCHPSTNMDLGSFVKTFKKRDGQKNSLSIYHNTLTTTHKYHLCILEYQRQSYGRRLICSKRPLSS